MDHPLDEIVSDLRRVWPNASSRLDFELDFIDNAIEMRATFRNNAGDEVPVPVPVDDGGIGRIYYEADIESRLYGWARDFRDESVPRPNRVSVQIERDGKFKVEHSFDPDLEDRWFDAQRLRLGDLQFLLTYPEALEARQAEGLDSDRPFLAPIFENEAEARISLERVIPAVLRAWTNDAAAVTFEIRFIGTGLHPRIGYASASRAETWNVEDAGSMYEESRYLIRIWDWIVKLHDKSVPNPTIVSVEIRRDGSYRIEHAFRPEVVHEWYNGQRLALGDEKFEFYHGEYYRELKRKLAAETQSGDKPSVADVAERTVGTESSDAPADSEAGWLSFLAAEIGKDLPEDDPIE